MHNLSDNSLCTSYNKKSKVTKSSDSKNNNTSYIIKGNENTYLSKLLQHKG